MRFIYTILAVGFLLAVSITAAIFLLSEAECSSGKTADEPPVYPAPKIVHAGNLQVRPVRIIKSGGLSDIDIVYPEVGETPGNIDLEISSLLYEAIITDAKVNGEVYVDLFAFYDNGWVHTELSYRVTYFSDNLLSVHFFGSLTGSGLGVRGFAAIQGGVTIDLVSKNVLELDDFITAEDLSAVINDHDFRDVYSFYITETEIGLIGIWGEIRSYVSVVKIEHERRYYEKIAYNLTDCFTDGVRFGAARFFRCSANRHRRI
jgi:hypothetical protein